MSGYKAGDWVRVQFISGKIMFGEVIERDDEFKTVFVKFEDGTSGWVEVRFVSIEAMCVEDEDEIVCPVCENNPCLCSIDDNYRHDSNSWYNSD